MNTLKAMTQCNLYRNWSVIDYSGLGSRDTASELTGMYLQRPE